MTARWALTRYAVTGGTGTLGRAIIRRLVEDGSAERVVSVSRDEVKIGQLLDEYGLHGVVRPLLGDVRDAPQGGVSVRLVQAFAGCQVVIHAAALKRIQQGAYSPFEMQKTNIDGTVNVIHAAAEAGVERLVVVSSDKACEPINLYGATKLVAEHLAVQANAYTWPKGLRIGVVRYGNVLGSRGSVLEVWARQLAAGGPLTISDPTMTRFVITQDQAARFVLDAVYDVQGGEVFVPILPACTVGDLANAFFAVHEPPEGQQVIVTGMRPGGEKHHERLLNPEEAAHRLRARDGRYVVTPSHREWTAEPYLGEETAIVGQPYDSAHAPKLTSDQLVKLIEEAA